MKKCECCKTNEVNKTTYFCDNCWHWTHNTEWGNIWYMVCIYNHRHPEDKFVNKLIELAFKEDRG